jgi:hypothetical protein
MVAHMKMTGGIAFEVGMQDYVELHDGIIVSPEDADIKVWRLGSFKYARSYINGKQKLLHRVIMHRMLLIEPPYHLQVDHINNNKLDNRRENLQLISGRQNTTKDKNRSSNLYRVHYDKGTSKFRVMLRVQDGKGSEHFGLYSTEEEAGFWADVWAYRLLKDGDALLNFPERIAEIEAEALKITNKFLVWQRKNFYATTYADLLALSKL